MGCSAFNCSSRASIPRDKGSLCPTDKLTRACRGNYPPLLTWGSPDHTGKDGIASISPQPGAPGPQLSPGTLSHALASGHGGEHRPHGPQLAGDGAGVFAFQGLPGVRLPGQPGDLHTHSPWEGWGIGSAAGLLHRSDAKILSQQDSAAITMLFCDMSLQGL